MISRIRNGQNQSGKSYDPKETADRITQALESAGVGRGISILPAYHLAQMALIANDILSVDAEFYYLNNRSEFIDKINILRNYVVAFRKHVLELGKTQAQVFNELDQLSSRQRRHYDFGVPAHRQTQKEETLIIEKLADLLQKAGASAANAAQFARELTELSEELQNFVWLVNKFWELKRPVSQQLWCLWIDIIEAWDKDWTRHGLWRLGEDEPDGIESEEPGFLGWSKVLLDELIAIEYE